MDNGEEVKKIKVFIGISSFIIGGAQKLVADQLKYFDRKKFDLHLIILFDFPAKKSLLALVPSDVKIHQLNSQGFNDRFFWFTLFKLLKKHKPEVVVSHLFFSNTVFRVLKPFFSYKIITVEHNTYKNKTRMQILVDKVLSFLTYKIIGVSEEVSDFTIKKLGINPNKFVTIINGIDLNDISNFKNSNDKNLLRASLSLKKDDKLLLNVSRLVEQKNHVALINGFSQFLNRQDEKDYKLIIVGEGKLKRSLLELVSSLNLDKSVIFTGALDKDLVYAYLYTADIYVSSSLIEGFSISYIEAAAFGLPLLVSKTAGTSNIVKTGFNGYFLDNIGKKDVSDGLENIIGHNLSQMGKNSIDLAKNFDIKNNVKAYEDLILNCCGADKNGKIKDMELYEITKHYVDNHISGIRGYEKERYVKDWLIKDRLSKKIIHDFIKRAGDPKDKKFLDIGFGNGITLSNFALHGADCYGLEIDADLLPVAEKIFTDKQIKGNLKIYNGRDFFYHDNFFDYAFSVSVFEHCSYPEEVLAETIRVLKPGGKFYLSYPNKFWFKEAHTGLWFLSYMPRLFGKKVSRLFGSNAIDDLNLHFLSFFWLKRIIKKNHLPVEVIMETQSEKKIRRFIKYFLSKLGLHHNAINSHIMVVLRKK